MKISIKPKNSYKDKAPFVTAQAFDKQRNLVAVDLPRVTKIGSDAFAHCEKLYRVNMPLLEIVENDDNPNPNCISPLGHKRHSTDFNGLILPNIVEAIFYKLICSNCGWHNSMKDLAYFCPKCGKDLKCGHLKEI